MFFKRQKETLRKVRDALEETRLDVEHLRRAMEDMEDHFRRQLWKLLKRQEHWNTPPTDPTPPPSIEAPGRNADPISARILAHRARTAHFVPPKKED